MFSLGVSDSVMLVIESMIFVLSLVGGEHSNTAEGVPRGALEDLEESMLA